MMMQQASTVSHIVRTLCSALHFAYTWLRVWLTTFHCCGQSGQRSDRVRFPPPLSFSLPVLVHTDAAQGIAMLWNDLWTQLNGILIKDIILHV